MGSQLAGKADSLSGIFLVLSKVMILVISASSLVLAGPGVSLQEGARSKVQEHDLTNFPLVGKHRTVPCGDCHLDGVLEGTPIACETCHWTRRQDDRYELRLGIHCGDCHTP